MRWGWSDEVREMMTRLKPYIKPEGGGIRDDSPEEIKALYEKFCRKVDEESWM